MARYKIAYVVEVVDVNGDVATTTVTTSAVDTLTLALAATNMAAIETAIAAATNGKVIRQSLRVLFNEAQYVVGTAPPTDAKYPSVTDGARFQFANGAGERTAVTIPAPLEALFGANSMVIDSTQTQAAAVIAMMETYSADLAGTAFNLYKGGIKVGRRARRRRTSLIP